MRRTLSISLAVVTALCTSAWTSPTDVSDGGSIHTASTVPLTPVSTVGSSRALLPVRSLCWSCDNCDPQHDWAESVQRDGLNFLANGDTYCWQHVYTCGSQGCGQTDDQQQLALTSDEVTEIWDAATSDDAGRVRKILRRFDKNVWLNAKRGAIQFSTACAGQRPVGSAPLSEAVLSELSQDQP